MKENIRNEILIKSVEPTDTEKFACILKKKSK